MERDRHRLATFMSKCDGLGDTPSAAAAASAAALTPGTSSPQLQSTGASVVDVSDSGWKDLLEVGDLVDARDASQVWYQVRFASISKIIYIFQVKLKILTTNHL